MCGGSFVATLIVYAGLLGEEAEQRQFVQTLFSWIPVGALQVDIGFLADPLSITMALFVTGVSTLIHLYSIGYMHGDPDFSKFFVYMNLFVFSMLMLVLGSNLLVTFIGWEGVGACSYLLIAFWFTDQANASAGKKAFITNRIGDWGFLIAIFLAFASLGTVDYLALDAGAGSLAAVTATAIGLLLFVGAVGKSAQIPLYLWLPDAMAGPTPVSALIHAATMVTGGVFLMTRVNPILAAGYDWVPDVIAWVGALTALVAATIAVAQNDIKKVLAYSTISQLGYMFLAVGVGAYVAAEFHMVTHAFFKAPAVPRGGLGDPRPARRAGHAQDGRAAEVHADHRRDVHRRLAGDLGRSAVRRLLVEGRHPAVHVGQRRRRRQGTVGDRPGHGPPHRLLHEPPGLPGLLRQAPLGRRTGRRSRARRRRGQPGRRRRQRGRDRRRRRPGRRHGAEAHAHDHHAPRVAHG